MKSAAAELWDGLPQAAHDVIERQQGAAPELDDDGLLGLGQYGAAGLTWPIGASAPLGDRLRVQPVAGGEAAGRFLRSLELGSNSRRRAG